MPRIDTYTAPSRPAQANERAVFVQGGESPATQLAQNVQQLSTRWATIAGTLKAQQADLEFTHMRSRAESGKDAILLNLDNDVTLRDEPWKYENEFLKRTTALYDEIQTTSKVDLAQRAFGTYARDSLEHDVVKARARGLKLWQGENLARLNSEEDDMADRAASTLLDPTNYDEKGVHKEIARYHDVVDRAYERNTIDGKERVKRYQDFEKKVLTRNMAYLARTDPEKLSEAQLSGLYANLDADTQEKFLRQGRELLQHRDNQTSKVMKDVNDYVWQWVVQQVEQDTLPTEYYEDIRQGKNPFVPASKAETIRNLRANIGRADDSGANAIMDEFRRGSFADPEMTMRRVAASRAELNAYADVSGAGSRTYSEGLKELKAAEIQAGAEIRSLKAAGKSDVSFAQARQHEEFKRAEEIYDSKVQQMSPLTRSLFPNMKPQDMGKINTMIRKGVKVEDAIDQILGDRIKGFDLNKTQKQKDLDMLLKGQR